jgi:ketol-acid reductoisomerase
MFPHLTKSMSKIWRSDEVSLGALSGKRIAVIGFGSQGRAQAENLRDSGAQVTIGCRAGASMEAAQASGFVAEEIGDALEQADVLALLVPERAHKEVIEGPVNSHAKPGAALVFAHGYTVAYEVAEVRGDLQRLLVAPKAIGPQLRRLYEHGFGAPALIAADPGDLDLARAYAVALGCGRAAIIESSFQEEAETDLFGEQAVLCGGLPALAQCAFETLVSAGYSREAAYFECVYEIKLIADLIFERGIAGMVDSISDTAQFGAMIAGGEVIGESSREAMSKLLGDIRSGRFAANWEAEQQAGMPNVARWRERLESSEIEATRRNLAPAESRAPVE